MQNCGSSIGRDKRSAKSGSSFRQRLPAGAPLIAIAIILVAMSNESWLLAQETTKPAGQSTTSSTQPGPSAPIKIPGEALYNLLQERSIVFPDIAASTEPLSSGQKFELFVDNSISVHTITWSAMGSGFGQALDSPTGFGQGGEAYAKRFGSAMARHASSEFFATFALASALHEDPRFFPEINPTFAGSIKYSLRSLFVTRNDAGQIVPNVAGLLGPALGEGLANAYWPDRNRTVGDTLMRYGLDLAARAGGNMLREYWPVFYGKLRRSDPAGARH